MNNLYHLQDSTATKHTVSFPPLLTEEELRRKTSFAPIVQKQMTLIEEAEAFVVIHPDWWGGPPAILKGWLDRVFRPETAYSMPEDGHGRNPLGLLSGRKAFTFILRDGPENPSLRNFWNEGIWGFCGAIGHCHEFNHIYETEATMRRKILEQAAQAAVEFLLSTSKASS